MITLKVYYSSNSGTEKPSAVQSILYVCLSVYVAFRQSKCVSRNFVQQILLQATGSMNLSGSTIFLSVEYFAGLFCCICISVDFHFGGPACCNAFVI